jgi:hypothetical protein
VVISINDHSCVQKWLELANLARISIYTTSSAFRGIPDISSFKSGTAVIKSSSAKHQISASSGYFLQLLSNSSPATAASQQQQPKQTHPQSPTPLGHHIDFSVEEVLLASTRVEPSQSECVSIIFPLYDNRHRQENQKLNNH